MRFIADILIFGLFHQSLHYNSQTQARKNPPGQLKVRGKN